MTFQESKNEAELLTKSINGRKISFGTIKALVAAPIDIDEYNTFLRWWFNNQFSYNHYQESVIQSKASEFDIYVIFEEKEQGKDIHIRKIQECIDEIMPLLQ
jgi:hypothetical protein